MQAAEIDWPKLEETALALLPLTMRDDGPRAWKGLDYDLMDRLHARGWIHDPEGKAKFVLFTEDGARLASELFARHVSKSWPGAGAAAPGADATGRGQQPAGHASRRATSRPDAAASGPSRPTRRVSSARWPAGQHPRSRGLKSSPSRPLAILTDETTGSSSELPAGRDATLEATLDWVLMGARGSSQPVGWPFGPSAILLGSRGGLRSGAP